MELLDDFSGGRDVHRVAKSTAEPPPRRTFQRKSSFKQIQSAISRIKPEVLKSVIADSGGFAAKQNAPAAPVSSPAPSSAAHKCLDADKAPLTIFYSGKVVVVDLTPDKANSILQLAEKGSAGEPTAATADKEDRKKKFAKIDDGDLPIARSRSLQRFLHRRKNRLSTPSPFKNEAGKLVTLVE